MKRYLVTAEVTISVCVEVEANSEEEAKELAREMPMQSLCHSCSSMEEDTWCPGGDLDGEVTNLRIGEA